MGLTTNLHHLSLLLSTIVLTLFAHASAACVQVKPGVEVYTAGKALAITMRNYTIANDEWVGVGFVNGDQITAYLTSMEARIHVATVNASMEWDNNATVHSHTLGTLYRALIFTQKHLMFCGMIIPKINRQYDRILFMRGELMRRKREPTEYGKITELIVVRASSYQKQSDIRYCQNSNTTSLAAQFVKDSRISNRKSMLVNGLSIDAPRMLTFIGLIAMRKTVVIRSRFSSTLICICIDAFFAIAKSIISISYAIAIRGKSPSFIRIVTLSSISNYVSTYGSVFSFICVSLLYSLQTLRYFLARNMYQIIQRQSKILKISNNKFIIAARLLLSKTAMVLLTVAVFLSGTGIILFRVIRPGKHIFKDEGSNSVFALAPLGFIIAGFSAPAVVLDWMLNFKAIWKRGIFRGVIYHYMSDPLFYRIEIVLVEFLLVPGVILAIAYAIKPIPQFSITLDVIASLLFFFFYHGAFAMIVEIARLRSRWFVEKAHPTDQLDMIEKVLTNPQTLRMMKDYAAREFSSENIALWEILWKYKSKGGMKFTKAQMVYDLFLSVTSTMEVNVPANTKRQFKSLLDSCNSTGGMENEEFVDIIPFKEFSSLYADTLANINETYARFCNSTEYKSHVLALEAENHLLQNTFDVDDTLLTSYRQLEEQ